MAVTITAAQSFDIFVLILPNADWDQGDGNPLPVNVRRYTFQQPLVVLLLQADRRAWVRKIYPTI